MIFTSIVIIAIVVYGIWHLMTYNALTNARFATQQSWSNVEVELKRRLDLIGNLVEIVKGYAKHEADTLTSTVTNRNLSHSSASAAAASESAPVIKDTISKIFILAEAYPDLKASSQFLNLQNELATTENRIAERRNAYNQTVSAYQNICRAVPSNIIAGLHDFKEVAFFDIPDAEAQQIPSVKLS